MNRIPSPKQSCLPIRSWKTAALAVALGVLAFSAPVHGAASGGSSFATTGSDPYAMGEKVIFASLSAGGVGYYGNISVPPLLLGFDYGFHQYMTLGGIFGYSRYSYSYIGSNDDLTYITIAARGTFHPTFWMKKLKVPLDPYGIATLGYTVGSYSGPGSRNYSILVIGPSVGARYWFLPNLAGQAEAGLGYGVGLASIGLSLKF